MSMLTDAMRARCARDIERVRRIYEIKADAEAMAADIRKRGGVKPGESIPREVVRLLLCDWDRVLDRVWQSYHQGAYYECVVLRRLFHDVTLEHEFHVIEESEGLVTHVDPDGSVHDGYETFGHEVHRYKNAESQADAVWCLSLIGEVLDKYENAGYVHSVYARNVTNPRGV